MYADVVVLTYQSPDINYFTYLVPKNLEKEIKVGQLVQVPFGSRNPVGIVLSIVNRPSTIVKKVKPITSILIGNPILLAFQIELLKWMSTYYIAPMANCLEAILPELPKRVARLEGFLTARSQTNEQNSTIEFRKRALAGGKDVTGPAQTLVLVPTINRIPQTLAQFPKAKNYAIYHNELKLSEKFSTWLKILKGNVDYIFGSRSAIFAPCPALSQITIFDEHDSAYKDNRSPYFDTLTVAQKISALTGAQIKIIDSAPKIQTYFSMQQNISIPAYKSKESIINMQNEKLAGNYSALSTELLTLLRENLTASKNSLLFLNKKKEAGALFCKDCKNHQYLQTAPNVCPNCQSSNIYFNVLNITSLSKEIQKQIPGAQVNLISENVYRRSTIDYRQSIDIATASIFYAQLTKKYDLVAHIAPDTLINRADFSSSETLYAQITNLKSLLKETGTLILQTASVDNLVIKTAASGNYQAFYNEQLKLRRALSYPPFALLVKLTIKGKNSEKLEEKAEKLKEELTKKDNSPLAILGPFRSIFFDKQSQFNIIIKYKLNSYSLTERDKAIKFLQDLRNLKDVQITVEPESIN